MPTNDFLSWASGGSANIMGQSDYAGSSTRTNGVQAGTASSALANKTWRQGANVAAMLGEFIRLHGYDALDDGDVATLETNYEAALTAFTNALIAAGATPFATLAEVLAGTATGKAVDPAKLAAAINSGTYVGATAGGTANALTAAVAPAPASLSTRMVVQITIASTNTAAATLNLNSLGAKSIVRRDGSALVAGDLVAGQIATLIYDGTNWRLGAGQSRPSGMQVYTTAGSYTFTVPYDVFRLRYKVIGGGAAGGSANFTPGCGGCGGGGGVSEGWTDVTPGQTIAVTVGSGGTGVVNNSGNNGGTSSFGAVASATGGVGGTGGSYTYSGDSGAGSGGQWNYGLGDGDDGISVDIGGVVGLGGGPGGSSGNTAGAPGRGSGGGGGGSANGYAGGAGAAGAVILEW